jgi:hypothetical protein
MDLRPTLMLIHVLAPLVFVIAHGVSAVAMFQVRGQSDRAVLTATLNRSSKALIVAYIALLVLLVAGVILGFVGGWWGSLWIWVSLVLLVVVGGAMTPFAGIPMSGVRAALQVGKPKPGKPPAAPKSDEELAAARAALRPELVLVIGLAGLIAIMWLIGHEAFLRTRNQSGHPIELSRPPAVLFSS